MITDELIKKEFITRTMRAGIEQIYSTQQAVIDKYLSERTGELKKFIMRRPFSEQSNGMNVTYYMRILPYIRLLDIHYRQRNDRIAKAKHSHLALYNRVVWGVLYRESFPELRYGLSEDVRKAIKDELEQALSNNPNNQ